MKHKNPWVAAIIGLAILASWLAFSARWRWIAEQDPPINVGRPVSPPREVGKGFRVSAGLDWENTDEDQLREWVEILGSVANAKSEEIDVVLEAGEILLTHGLETESGVFHFTSIVPQFQRDEQGREEVFLQMSHSRVDVSGNDDKSGATEFHLREGCVGEVAVLLDRAMYSVAVLAKEISAERRVRLFVAEEVKARVDIPLP